jgi:hypothetical protein
MFPFNATNASPRDINKNRPCNRKYLAPCKKSGLIIVRPMPIEPLQQAIEREHQCSAMPLESRVVTVREGEDGDAVSRHIKTFALRDPSDSPTGVWLGARRKPTSRRARIHHCAARPWRKLARKRAAAEDTRDLAFTMRLGHLGPNQAMEPTATRLYAQIPSQMNAICNSRGGSSCSR